jgi:hypothetical protein
VSCTETRGNVHECAGIDSYTAPDFGIDQDSTVQLTEEEHTESTTKTTESQLMTSQPSSTSVEHQIMKISTGAIEFPMT